MFVYIKIFCNSFSAYLNITFDCGPTQMNTCGSQRLTILITDQHLCSYMDNWSETDCSQRLSQIASQTNTGTRSESEAVRHTASDKERKIVSETVGQQERQIVRQLVRQTELIDNRRIARHTIRLHASLVRQTQTGGKQERQIARLMRFHRGILIDPTRS